MLYLNVEEDGRVETYQIPGEFGYTWKTYGPFCAPQGWHNFTFTSDANTPETRFLIKDSYGLIKACGGMDDFPMRFHTTLPSKYCTAPDAGYTPLQIRQRTQKILAAADQFISDAELAESGFRNPREAYEQDGVKMPPLTVDTRGCEELVMI